MISVMSLERTASIVRKYMLSRSFIATQTFFSELLKESLPQALLALVTMILVGQKLNLPVNPKNALNISKVKRSLYQNV